MVKLVKGFLAICLSFQWKIFFFLIGKQSKYIKSSWKRRTKYKQSIQVASEYMQKEKRNNNLIFLNFSWNCSWFHFLLFSLWFLPWFSSPQWLWWLKLHQELVHSALLESNTGRDDCMIYNKLVRMSDIWGWPEGSFIWRLLFPFVIMERNMNLNICTSALIYPQNGDIIYMKITFSLYEVIFLVFAIELYLQNLPSLF